MKFQTLGVTHNIFEPGRLKSLYEDLNSGASTKDVKQLSVDQLAQIPSIYAKLETDVDITKLENDKVYKTGNDKDILGSDIKAITMLMYTKARSAYCNFKPGNQVHTPSVNGAVPLGLLGFKRFRGIPYDKWRMAILHHVECDYDVENRKFKFKFSKEALEKIFKLDLLLGKTLASTYYDASDDTIKLNEEKNWGLVLLSALDTVMWTPKAQEIHLFRTVGMGNFSGNFATTYGTAGIKNAPKERSHITFMYNKCDTPMRLLIAQRWAFYGMHRGSDMICDFQDWDNLPKSIDDTSVAFKGIEPQQQQQGLAGRFGL